MSNFIPKIYKKEQITIRIDSEQLMLIEEIGKDLGISRSEFINQCIAFALEHMCEEKSRQKQEN